MSGLGVDVSTFSDDGSTADLDPSFKLISGTRAVLEAVARRLITRRGTLLEDPEYGFDLRAYQSAKINSVREAAILAGARAEALKDERVTAAVASFNPNAGPNKLHLILECETDGGSFSLVFGINSTSIETAIELISVN